MRKLNHLWQVGFFLLIIACYTSCGNTKTEKALPEGENEKALADTAAETAMTKDVAADQQTSGNLEDLKQLNGKYPHEVHLFEHTALTNRLKSLLKDRYDFFKDTWAVESPIEIHQHQFVAFGCQQHNCGDTNFIIVVDFSKDVLYAGIRENGVVKTYSEDGSSNAEIIKWTNNK